MTSKTPSSKPCLGRGRLGSPPVEAVGQVNDAVSLFKITKSTGISMPSKTPPRKPGLGRGHGQMFKFGSPVEPVTQAQVMDDLSPDDTAQSQSDCLFCNRKPQQILCHACGHCFHGRLRGSCSSHPGIIHLMDYLVCPCCLSGALREFTPRVSAVPEVSPCKATSQRGRQDSWHEEYY